MGWTQLKIFPQQNESRNTHLQLSRIKQSRPVNQGQISSSDKNNLVSLARLKSSKSTHLDYCNCFSFATTQTSLPCLQIAQNTKVSVFTRSIQITPISASLLLFVHKRGEWGCPPFLFLLLFISNSDQTSPDQRLHSVPD